MHPVGPLPASTYWRRRVVLVGLVVVLLLLLKGCAGGGGSGRPTAARPTPTRTASPTPAPTRTAPSPSPSPTQAVAAGACRDAVLRLAVTTDAPSYAVGASPTFTLTATNTGAAACTRDLGPTAVSFTVVSGAARTWSSDDCSPASGHATTTLAPGKAVRVVTLTWTGKRSQPGCPSPRAQAEAGTYQVSGTVGTLTSPRAVFRFR